MASQTSGDGKTVLEHLTKAGVDLQKGLSGLRKAESQLRAAGQPAADEGRIQALRKDIDAVANIVGETIVDLIQRSVEMQAKS